MGSEFMGRLGLEPRRAEYIHERRHWTDKRTWRNKPLQIFDRKNRCEKKITSGHIITAGQINTCQPTTKRCTLYSLRENLDEFLNNKEKRWLFFTE